ncbi:MAG: gamma-glutamyl-gamma-aminobutyrate hydrolase family protein [Alphaproteobacteria bacterium]|nr:gamma-glutamyl-gamma-aminobutyrate hydrolase family protein [Alphaproteobacteria bacterium]
MRPRPAVGVSASARGGRIMWWFNRASIRLAGGRAVRLTPETGADWRSLDALVLGGGDDIGAEIYHGRIAPDVRVDPRRDRMELDLLDHAEARRLPVLGICRGAQMLNVFRGGSLYPDIYEVFAAPRMRTALPRKRVTIERSSRLHGIVGADTMMVNSLHHQAVDRPGERLRPVARDDAGIVQAIEGEGERLLIGVQWHPEFLIYRGRQHGLFEALVRAA